ncbi:MAG: flavin-nucleotide-binding protein [Acidimicrobiaceae bacterium]|nr:flavin-nucleotide-binding protein [Acidimicrobiaceae bacterium]MEE2806272.1 pyridoxamine 5'-phosphate oxidase family protein [Actinomycetota bacterium]
MHERNEASSKRTAIRRMPDRGSYDRETIHSILDEGLLAHVGMTTEQGPVVIPMLYGREEESLFLHGSPASRLLRDGRDVELCVTVSLVDGLVVARSLFHHSMNYRSVVVMGEASPVEDLRTRARALDVISDHVIPGRVAGTRPHHESEVRGTLVLSMSITEASAKIRTGPPVDDEEDHQLDTWAGILPIGIEVGTPIPDPQLRDGITTPAHISQWSR